MWKVCIPRLTKFSNGLKKILRNKRLGQHIRPYHIGPTHKRKAVTVSTFPFPFTPLQAVKTDRFRAWKQNFEMIGWTKIIYLRLHWVYSNAAVLQARQQETMRKRFMYLVRPAPSPGIWAELTIVKHIQVLPSSMLIQLTTKDSEFPRWHMYAVSRITPHRTSSIYISGVAPSSIAPKISYYCNNLTTSNRSPRLWSCSIPTLCRPGLSTPFAQSKY